jgi:hypothetical protein
MDVTGYLHPFYVESLAEFGRLRALEACGGWVLERSIPGSTEIDAMGCYPLFCCRDWPRIADDLRKLQGRLVSLALVTDPLGNYDEGLLRGCFDYVLPFKHHFVADLTQPVNQQAPKYHRKYARRSLRDARVEVLSEPSDALDDWGRLYANLVARHQIKGIRAFSRAAFAAQLKVPGMVAFRAVVDSETVGMHLWYVQGEAAYSHLSAYTDFGYDLQVSYGLNWVANEHFAGNLRWLVLGAGAGTGESSGGGLTEYKRGWSTGIRQVYFCGRTLNPEMYRALAMQLSEPLANYFPAYRAGEFS